MTKKICISGYYGFDNFGDETILKILIENLKKFDCNPQITVFSSNPAKTSKLYDVNSVQSFNLLKILKELLTCNCLISGGGSLLQDATSKKSLIYYLGILFLSQLFRKKTVIFAQGIGPINDKFLAKLTAILLKNAHNITVRDDNSLALLKEWNIPAKKCYDPVWNININKNNNSNKIGIQLRDFHSITPEFIIRLASCINKYYDRKEIFIFSLQNKLDLEICNTLRNELLNINKNLCVKVVENNSNEEVISNISQMDEIIAMRYHACLIAIKAGIKLLPVNYDIKVENLAREFNLKAINPDICSSAEKTFDEFIHSQINYDENKINAMMFDFKEFEKNII